MAVVTSYTKEGILSLIASVEWHRGPVGDDRDLNEIDLRGLYTQDEDDKARQSLNYPVQKWGYLQVFPDGDSGGTIQQYMTSGAMYIRRKSSSGTWSEWTSFSGPKGDRGPAGINFTGPYDNDTAYKVGDAVTSGGSTYVALAETKGDGVSDSSKWALLAAKGNVGEPGLVWKGEWSDAALYKKNDVVFRSGSAYVYLAESGKSQDPLTNSAVWSLVAKKGDTGSPGPPGPPGGTQKVSIIGENANLDNYTATGVYYQDSDTNASTNGGGVNYPVEASGILEVVSDDADTPAFVIQFYYPKDAKNETFVRRLSGSTWGAWSRLIKDDELTTPRSPVRYAPVRLDGNGKLTTNDPASSYEVANKRYVDTKADTKLDSDKIQVVSELPSSPDPTVIYLIKEV